MNYIPFPRQDMDKHADLMAWRVKVPKTPADWKALKTFLHESSKIPGAMDALPKCWYSELPQGDNNALDIEHFRPKGSGDPLPPDKIRQIVLHGVNYQQNPIRYNYDWLEFNYRNYRLVTATTNRTGAKHIYFPIAAGAARLPAGALPWVIQEHAYFLDPTDPLDAALLYVKPNGEIAPLTPPTQLTAADFAALPHSWRSPGFNYLRSIVTIKLYRLDHSIFTKGRRQKYEETTEDLEILELMIIENPSHVALPRCIARLVRQILPSAPFSLAAKSALIAYISNHPDPLLVQTMNNIKTQIIQEVDKKIASLVIDWNKP